MSATIPEKVAEIVSPVYEVGGSLRDELMGREPTDFDFSTPRDPEYIEEKVREAKKKPLLVGKRFGTIGFNLDGKHVEITTFRVERYERGSRKPQVEFVDDITADLGRRDFTVNAIARRNDRIIDPFGGSGDIKGRIIRCVGVPTMRFKEDPLRILRAARLAAQLDFSIDPSTEKAMTKTAHKLLEVSKERWVAELDRLLLAESAESGLRYLMDAEICTYILPELSLQKNYDQNSSHHRYDLWEHTLRVVTNTPRDPDLRWAALLHDIAKPFVRLEKTDRSTYAKHDVLGADMVVRLGRHLKWANRRIIRVSALVKDHMSDESPLRNADMMAK
jgi:putative nucleotidyltransferase with HDIG domain